MNHWLIGHQLLERWYPGLTAVLVLANRVSSVLTQEANLASNDG